MKKVTLLLLILTTAITYSQVGVNTDTPDASSALEIKSTSAGILIPRMTEAQRDAIASPAISLMIYQTNNDPGFYFYDGSAWKKIEGVAGPQGIAGTNGSDGQDGDSAYQIWIDAGNTGTEADFLNALKGTDGADGTNGSNGQDGDSAYQIWLDAGNTGTEADFLNALKGTDGADGTNGTALEFLFPTPSLYVSTDGDSSESTISTLGMKGILRLKFVGKSNDNAGTGKFEIFDQDGNVYYSANLNFNYSWSNSAIPWIHLRRTIPETTSLTFRLTKYSGFSSQISIKWDYGEVMLY